jgi:hypothetical protein
MLECRGEPFQSVKHGARGHLHAKFSKVHFHAMPLPWVSKAIGNRPNMFPDGCLVHGQFPSQ